ncbi:MAG: thymidylate synthase complementing protein ThyX [Deltaproteobacteria bacterium RIFOXYD12_FULL_50_9]|nr:MAG: thymidylate synthase complementing protein ThyX [Deltaproteobacteria bacterium RIFOXYD12_FULL_50_9]
MNVIPASFTILDALDEQSLTIRIESCGRICYKSEDKIDEGSAEPFIRNIVKRGHNSVLEMGVLTLEVEIESDSLAMQLFETIPKYLHIDRLDKKKLLITGSVRAFREIYMANPTLKLVKAMTLFLNDRNPQFFFDLLPKRGFVHQDGVAVRKVGLAEVDKLPANLLAKHRHIAVKFFVNRAITHEIVRHRPCSYLQESQRYCRYSESKFDNQVTFIKPLFFEEGSEQYALWENAMRETEKIYLKLLESASPQAARTVLPNSCKTELITYANLLEWLHIFKLRTSPAAEPTMREVMIPLFERFRERFPSVYANIVIG